MDFLVPAPSFLKILGLTPNCDYPETACVNLKLFQYFQ